MKPEERERLEAEIRANNFVTVDDIPYTPTQLALLNWHKLDGIERKLEGKLDVTEFEAFRERMIKMGGFIVSFITIAVAIIAIVATA